MQYAFHIVFFDFVAIIKWPSESEESSSAEAMKFIWASLVRITRQAIINVVVSLYSLLLISDSWRICCRLRLCPFPSYWVCRAKYMSRVCVQYAISAAGTSLILTVKTRHALVFPFFHFRYSSASVSDSAFGES
jgi:hypothetical protein